jgi:uncharacterized protein (TIGR02147 family)
MVNLLDYLDYRQYLRDIFEERKRLVVGFSHRNLARKLLLTAPGHMLFIIQGKRRLTEEIARRFAKYMKFSKKEIDYLFLLIRYTDAKSASEKQFTFEELLSIRQRKATKMSLDSSRFYEKWYYSAIRASLDIIPFKGNFSGLARLLYPPITALETKRAVEILKELKMVKKDENGYWRPAEKLISTGDKWQSATIHNLHQQFMDLAKESLMLFQKEERETSSLTVTASAESFKLIKRKIQDLRDYIMSTASTEQNPDRVLQVNFQLFPLLKKENGVDK